MRAQIDPGSCPAINAALFLILGLAAICGGRIRQARPLLP